MRRSIAQETPTADFRQALARPGCAVCHLTHRAVGRFLKALSYEQVNDVDLRAELRTARGFCALHAQRWVSMSGNVLGTAIIYRDIINASLRDIDAPARGSGGLRGMLGGRPADPVCIACRFQSDAEQRFVDGLLAALAGLVDAFEASAGLCLPHTRMAVTRAGKAAEPIVEHARKAAQQLIAELDEVIRKEDYRFKHEPRTEAERTAPRRAVVWTTGLDAAT
jgi:hypothetical protein